MKKKLYRSKDRMVAGVVAGLAEYFNQDTSLWRLGAVILLIITGLMPGVLIYFLAALIIPIRGKADYTIE